MSSGVALLAGLALVGGCALILAFALFLAVLVSGKVDPGPAPPVSAQAERAERFRRDREEHEAEVERGLERRGREGVVWPRATFPTFLIVSAVFAVFGAWSAVADHAAAGGGPVPLSLLLRPLWLPWVPALLAALIIMADRRRNWERWPRWRKERERERRRSARRRRHRSRIANMYRFASSRHSRGRRLAHSETAGTARFAIPQYSGSTPVPRFRPLEVSNEEQPWTLPTRRRWSPSWSVRSYSWARCS